MSAKRIGLLSVVGVLLWLAVPTHGVAQSPKKVQPSRVDRHGQLLPAGAVARLGTTRFRSPSQVAFVGFVGDARKLLCVTYDGDARLWDLVQAKAIRSWSLPVSQSFGPEKPKLLELSGDGRTIAWRDAEENLIVGDVDTDAVHKRLTGKLPLESRRRREALRDKLDGPVPAVFLRDLRAIELLERIGSPEARQVLETLASGGPGHVVTAAAAMAVARLTKLAEKSP